jgi:hypothetical protein
MDPIEPVRLDMNLLNAAMAQRQHQAGLDETLRHHGVLEGQHVATLGVAQQKIQMDAADNVLKDPDASPFEQYTAMNIRLKAMGGTDGLPHEDIPPTDFMDNAPAWKLFATKLDMASSAQSPEVGAALQELSSKSPFFMKRAKQAMALKQQQDVQKGFQSMPVRAGQPALSPQESSAVQTSPPAQKAIAESAFPSAKDTAVMNEVNQRTAGLKVQEATATHAFQAMNKEFTPVFNMDAETAHVQTLAKSVGGSPLSTRLSTKDSIDQSALMSGTLTTEERQQAKQAIPEAMKEMNQRARALQQELHNAKNDVTGQARPPEQIQAELAAIRTAVTIKGKELSYLNNSNPATRKDLAQSYQAFQADLDQKKADVLRLRQASSGVAQGALNERIAQDQFNNKQTLDKAAAQAHYLEHRDLKATARLFPNITPDDIRQIDKPLDRPLVDIKMGESLSKEIGPMMTESRASALGAIDTIDTVGRARKAIESGLVSVGPTATIRQKIGQVAQMMGVGGKDNEEQIVNTRNVIRSLGQFSLAARKSLKGQGQVSDFEGKLLIKAESGDIEDMTIPELKSFLSVTDRLAHRQYDAHQHNLKTMKSNPKMSEAAPFYEVPELPTAAHTQAPSKSGTIKSQSDYDQIPSGSTYKAPDGTMRKKK